MEYVDEEAAETFYMLSHRSYELGIIGWSDLQMRLAYLLGMISPNSRTAYFLRELLPSELLNIEDQDNTDEQKDEEVRFLRGESEAGPESMGLLRFSPPPLIMQLIVAGVSGMKEWTFHEFDEDPFPSVPHGHRHGAAHPKCDPYTGVVFDARRKAIVGERLRRKTRVALWQNEQFREFALKAIIWYETEHPYFRFRVPHPRRLPRFRR